MQVTPGAGIEQSGWDASAAADDLDIYAVLGVSRQASLTLARQMYWLRIEEYQDAKEHGERSAATAIERLNAALTIFVDVRRRAEYDRTHVDAGTRVAEPPVVSRRVAHAGAVVTVMLLTLLGAVIAEVWGGTLPLLVVLSLGMAGLLVVVALPRPMTAAGAFNLLGLNAQATRREVDLAYEVTAQELLTRLKVDPAILAQLERLDRAYILVSSIAAGRSERSAGHPGFAVRLFLAAWRIATLVALPVVRAFGALALVVWGWLERLILRSSRAAGAQLRAGPGFGMRRIAEYLAGLSVQISRAQDEETTPISLQAERRLALGLDSPSIHERVRTEDSLPEGSAFASAISLGRVPQTAVAEMETVDAYLVLQSSAGERRVPIRSAPLRIGSAPHCDLVPPAHLDLAPEHALFWQTDGLVLMHGIDSNAATCLVNGQPMVWARLEDGDTVQLGKASFSISVAG